VRRFVGCILEEIFLFPVARTGLRERIRVPAAFFNIQSNGSLPEITLFEDLSGPVGGFASGRKHKNVCAFSLRTPYCADKSLDYRRLAGAGQWTLAFYALPKSVLAKACNYTLTL
jgi:hypothetical protein